MRFTTFKNRVIPLLALPAALVVGQGQQQEEETSERKTLGDFALSKILRDGREIFGDDSSSSSSSYPTTTTITTTTRHENWMAALPDSIPLTQLNIPGTHDTATWNYSQATQDGLRHASRCDGTIPGIARVYRCQRRSISESLDMGIRFFDLRFALDPLGEDLVFWHGPALLSAEAGVEDVLYGFYEWLERHGSETVVLSFQYEGSTVLGAENDEKVQRELFEILTSEVAGRFVYQGRGVVPTLGEARGKILLFRRFDLDALVPEERFEGMMPGLHMSPKKWMDNDSEGFELVYNVSTNGTAHVEDFYHPSTHLSVKGNIEAKFEAAVNHLEKAAEGEYEKLFVTFTSGVHVEIIPPVYPEIMALGPKPASTFWSESESESSHVQYAEAVEGVNYQLHDFLKGMRGKRLGIVVMDFFEEPEGLIDLLLDF
ncbi:PLC-like phosphodiesterase [Poronia punctata]|nr:PLC-like phosphodiesterase [Poronia punctata]